MQRIRCGIVGFGFIGPHHAEAMRRLGFVDLVAVCSQEPDAARRKLAGISDARVYDNYEDLIADPDVDVVDIATPTRWHKPAALAAMARGKHVIVDKPLALSHADARDMLEAAERAGVVHAVTFNYRANPVVQHARALVHNGELGDLRLLRGHYLQEWLLYPTDYSWRLDIQESGRAAVVADAGCHWFDLVEHVTGLRVTSVLADLATLVPVRKRPAGGAAEAFAAATGEGEDFHVRVPDYGAVLLRFHNGARGCFTASALAAGHKNDLRLALHGSRASLEWKQEQAEELWIGRRNAPNQLLVKDPSLLDAAAQPYAALPGGHGEAWPDAFRNTLRAIFARIAAGNGMPAPGEADFPTFQDGVRAAAIAEALVESSDAGGVWTAVPE